MVVTFKEFMTKYRKWLVPLFFVIMAYLSVAYLWHFHMVYYNSDFMFHLDRLQDIRDLINSRHFPLMATGTNIPYGITMTLYPWLTLIPIAYVALLFHSYISVFYVSIMLIALITYLVSYYSYHTYDKSWAHDFVFAVIYANGSIIFDTALRAGDLGSISAMAYLPLVIFGFLDLANNDRGILMFITGLILLLSSHVITGIFGLCAILIIWILSIFSIKLRDHLKILLGIAISITILSVFWYPAFKIMSLNNLVMPFQHNFLSADFMQWLGNPCNELYGIPSIIGVLSIVNIKHSNFDVKAFSMWLISVGSFLFNVQFIANIATRLFPVLLKIQFTNRTAMLSHLLCSILTIQWLTGKFKSQEQGGSNLFLVLLTFIMLLNPIFNQIDFHFLLHSRPIVYRYNKFKLDAKSATPYKYSNDSFKSLNHYIYNYDYSPNKIVKANLTFDMHNEASVFDRNDKWRFVRKYKPVKTGIIIQNNGYPNIRFPIVVYHGIKYTFSLNGRKMPKKYINQKLTWKNYELTLHNLPKGKNKVNIRSAKIN